MHQRRRIGEEDHIVRGNSLREPTAVDLCYRSKNPDECAAPERDESNLQRNRSTADQIREFLEYLGELKRVVHQAMPAGSSPKNSRVKNLITACPAQKYGLGVTGIAIGVPYHFCHASLT